MLLKNAVSKRAFAKCKALFVGNCHRRKIVIPPKGLSFRVAFTRNLLLAFSLCMAHPNSGPLAKSARDDSELVIP